MKSFSFRSQDVKMPSLFQMLTITKSDFSPQRIQTNKQKTHEKKNDENSSNGLSPDTS